MKTLFVLVLLHHAVAVSTRAPLPMPFSDVKGGVRNDWFAEAKLDQGQISCPVCGDKNGLELIESDLWNTSAISTREVPAFGEIGQCDVPRQSGFTVFNFVYDMGYCVKVTFYEMNDTTNVPTGRVGEVRLAGFMFNKIAKEEFHPKDILGTHSKFFRETNVLLHVAVCALPEVECFADDLYNYISSASYSLLTRKPTTTMTPETNDTSTLDLLEELSLSDNATDVNSHLRSTLEGPKKTLSPNDTMSDTNCDCQHVNDTSDLELKECEDELHLYRQDVLQCEIKRKEQILDIAQCDAEIEMINRILAKVQSELYEAKDKTIRTSSNQDETVHLRKELYSRDMDIEKLNDKIVELEDVIIDMKTSESSAISKLVQERDQLIRETEKMKKEIEDLKADNIIDIDELIAYNDRLNQKVASESTYAADCTAREGVLRFDVSVLLQQVSALKETIGALKSKLRRIEAEFNATISVEAKPSRSSFLDVPYFGKVHIYVIIGGAVVLLVATIVLIVLVIKVIKRSRKSTSVKSSETGSGINIQELVRMHLHPVGHGHREEDIF